MPHELSYIQELAENLSNAIANLHPSEYEELSETLNEQTDLNLGDLQSLLTTTNNLFKLE
jgi:hypothetical protein